MKTSIKVQMASITIAILSGTLILCWFINSTFLEGYYEREKERTVWNVYEMLNEAGTEEGAFSESFQEEMRDYAFHHNLTIVVLNPNAQVVLDASFNGAELTRRLFSYITGRSVDFHLDKMPEQNTVFRLHELRTNTEYMEMFGVLENGDWYIISCTIESIKDSVKIANRFLAYVGVAAVLIGCIICWLIARRFTKPILKLAEISEKMTRLDFEAKYQGKEKNEIALLGANINKLSESLEKNISELKTANNELKKDIEKKEKIDEMRKEFLANVSHELKTPIALIQGYAEGLQENVSDDVESRNYYCEVIIDEAAKMNAMVKKLLDLNHIEFGDNKVDIQRFDITSVINGIIASSSILIEQKEAKVLFGEKEEYVWADEYMIEEVITNYLSNALNHVSISEEKEKDAEKIINIYYEKKEKNLRVCIYNTGQHIPEAELEKVWIKFYKVDKARTRLYGGSGVGLSIVKAIMDSHNRACGVENVKNGVVFWFELECE